jgi:hypothetical protein
VTLVLIGLPAALCLWAMFSFRHDRMLLTFAMALFPVLAAGLATQLTGASDAWYALNASTIGWFSFAVFAAFGLRWLNHYPPTDGTRATATQPSRLDRWAARAVGVAYGILGALTLFSWAAWRLQGQPDGLRWHAIFAVGALVALGAAVRLRDRLAAFALAPFALVILGLSGWGALIFPDIVRARTAHWVQQSEGRAFCFAAPRVESAPPGYVGPLERAFAFASWPREPHDLTLLTIAKPFLLVVEHENPALQDDFDLEKTFVWDIWRWAPDQLDFVERQTEHIVGSRPANFVDCHPRRDYLAQAMDRDLREGVVLSRPLLDGTGRTKDWKWGPLLRDAFTIPASMKPRFRRRFFDEVRLDILAPLLPGQDPFWLSLHYWHHPEVEVGYYTRPRFDGVVDPGDLAAWQLNDLGLHDLYPSSDPKFKWFGAYRADGRIRTYIECKLSHCTHSFIPETPLWQSDVYIRTAYPIALLPQWDKIEAAALAQFLALRVPD